MRTWSFLAMLGGVNSLLHAIAGGTGIPGVFASMGISAVFIGMGLDALSALYTAYNRACMRLEDETWLRNNCKDPVFFSKMRAHTTVCSDVEANARVGAFWTAMREVSDGTRAYVEPVMIYLAVISLAMGLLVPMCCLCVQRMGFAHTRRLRCLPVHQSRSCLKDV